MKNYIAAGRVLDYTNGTGSVITSGSVVVADAVIGISTTDIAIGDVGAVNLEGVYSVTSVGFAGNQGKTVFWDTVALVATGTANANTKYMGNLYKASLVGDATVQVILGGARKSGRAVFVAQIATANASDLATVITLANQNKATLNALLTSLIQSDLMAAS